MTTKGTTWLLVAALVLGSGCAKRDWTQEILVTVDVTGVWSGTSTACLACGTSVEVRLELEQEGPKVVGNMQLIGPVELLGGSVSPEIDGSVTGDVFRFKQRSGLRPITGEMTVDGDRMSGSMSFGSPIRLSLRRMGPLPRKSAQP